ncbi:TonB-dependent receptor [Parasediminibacterium sp. JCM 36343]|uniref:TonB-dependent receptor n=1 Tax=Parasediminibacterium sp. JCM 36343 TaxID=3374279 RepID=UPI00397B9CEC
MIKYIIPIFFLLLSISAIAQQNIQGNVVDAATNQPIEGCSITLQPANIIAITDIRGRFSFKNKTKAGITVSVNCISYASQVLPIAALQAKNAISLAAKQVSLQDVTVVNNAGNQYKPISKTDIAMRGVNNSQEVLRIIPGIVIGQHQGGGKAEQIFLRGFDADHGTDFSEAVDGMPINMVSHAHGQGFADSHFIIPETIESVDFKKGPYTASKGDFCTTGFVDFNTKNALSSNVVKAELGMFNTYRALGMFNLLNKKAKEKQQSWYVASEYRYSDAYFDNPQHFKRFNLFTKYTGKLSAHTYLTVSATTFWSKWDASGQIPERAVDKGIIGFYGAIDPYEGGITYRTNANVQLVTTLNNGGLIKNQLYYSNYHFDLHTNFTFYLVDTVNGDEIRQKEDRDLVGYNGSYTHTGYVGNVKLATEAGINVRADLTHNTGLSHTVDRYTTLNQIKLGEISELSISPYLSETFSFNEHFSMNAGLRFDQFYHRYNNQLASDTTLPGIGVYKAQANTLSPKLNFYYHVNDRMQFYLTTGRGFHSNDTRAVVVTNGYEILPSAYGADFGTVVKPATNLLLNAAVWYIYLGQEFVYGGDGGDVSFNGKTKRVGFDFSGRYEPIKSLYIDVDVNYAHGRAIDEPKGANYIPLAPVWTSTGGITYTPKKGVNGSLRYRFVGNRPGNEDYSLTATGYFITDAVINYSTGKWEYGVVVNNVLNTKWKETQFDTETRLKGELAAVDEMCFTPGTPFCLKASVMYKF